jgi:ferredoxin-NADP reductase
MEGCRVITGEETMANYQVKLIGRKEIATNTMSFVYEKPKNFTFKPGQHANFSLIDPPENDDEGNTRYFSFANPPYAEDLMIATRMRNTAFKRVLKTLPLGTELKLNGPTGSFTLHENVNIPAIYLTGGIGITPVRSTLLQAAQDKLPHKLLLFYSNYKPEDAPFLEELMQLKNPNYQFIGTMTEMEKSRLPWKGETGLINKNMLLKYIDDLTKPIYYISGPESLVKALRNILKEAGVSNDNIRTEEFAGY